jgi:hypothetical protein
MRLSIVIELENDAFKVNEQGEVKTILQDIVDDYNDLQFRVKNLYDSNGNPVGKAKITK